MKVRPKLLLRFTICSALAMMILAASSFASPRMAVTVSVSPTNFSTPVGGVRQLTAQVNGAASPAVTWTVNDIVGGNSMIGTIDTTGKYTAPAVPPAGWTVTAKAISVADPSV